MSVSTATGGLSPNSAILASVDVSNDPVTKAVMENVMGRLPTKKPRVRISLFHMLYIYRLYRYIILYQFGRLLVKQLYY